MPTDFLHCLSCQFGTIGAGCVDARCLRIAPAEHGFQHSIRRFVLGLIRRESLADGMGGAMRQAGLREPFADAIAEPFDRIGLAPFRLHEGRALGRVP